MARPNKQGVDYFPLDVHLDDKMKFVEIKYKLEGFAVVVKLMQRIYANGYWCKWSEDELLLFSDEIKADFSLVDNVVHECIKRDIFDSNLYINAGILTSKGIQKRYKEIVRRRKEVEVIEEYLLIDNIFGINDGINPAESKQNDVKSTQSKVNRKETEKEKETKTKKTKTISKIQYAEFVSLKEEEYQKLISEHGEEKVKQMIQVLDNYKGSSGKNYKDDYRAILNWVVERVGQATNKSYGGSYQNRTGKKSLFEQGEESKKRQAQAEANIRKFTEEEEKEMDKLLPF